MSFTRQPPSKQRNKNRKNSVRVNVVAAHRLNAPLQQMPAMPNSITWHTLTIEGNIDSPLRMFLNWLPITESVISVLANKRKCFDEIAPTPVKFNLHDEYSDTDTGWSVLSIDWQTIAEKTIRQTLQGYEIQNAAFDDSDSDW